jgi:hypothetical protein
VFFDGYSPTPKILKMIMTLLKTRGLLISANQTLGGKDTYAYRAAIMDKDYWLTAFIGPEQETALSVKL